MAKPAETTEALLLPWSPRPASRSDPWRSLGFWAAIIFILLTGGLSYLSLRGSIDAAEAAMHARDIRAGAGTVLALLKDAETGARGFIITGEEEYLAPYEQARAQVPQALEHLRQLIRDDARQVQRIARLAELSEGKLASVAELVELRRRDAGPLDPVALDSGKAIMDEIRTLVAELNAEETRIVEGQRAATGERAQVTMLAILIGTLASAAIIVGIFYAMRQEMDRRRNAEARAQLGAEELERQVRARTVDLETSRNFLHAVLDNVQDAIFVNKSGRIVLANKACLRLFGMAGPHELLGRTPYDLFHPDYHQVMRGRTRILLEQKGQVPTIEEKIIRRDGTVVEVEASPDRFFDGEGDVIVSVLHDISERSKAEAALRQGQRMEAVGQLSGGLAHDFNNLLVVIIGNLELLQERLHGDAEAHMQIEAMLQAAWRGADLTGQLLAFARRQILEPKVIDLNGLVKATSGLLRRTLGERIVVELRQADSLWPVLADPAQLESALTNLAINARDAMPGGGRLLIETSNCTLDEAYVELHADVVPGDYVMLAVSDSGTGIAPSVLPRVFEPFFTTKGNGKGTGLGLSMVYGFVKQTHGHIQIYSEVGQGTTVRIYLPRVGGSAQPTAESRERDAEVRAALCILVVDDRADVRAIVARQLRELGHRVLEATGAEAALAILGGEEPIDLLFTDVVLPGGLDGDELARRGEALRPQLAVLLTSGFADATLRSDRLTGLRQRYTLLSKPYRRRDLVRRLAQAMQRRQEQD